MKERSQNLRTIQRITIIGALINIALATAKIAVGTIFYSQALIADGIHSLSDLISDAAVLIGARFWEEKPDKLHPYGHGRVETLISLGIGIGLGIVAVTIITESIEAIREPAVNMLGYPALIVALISIVMKEMIYRWTVRIGNQISSRALIANAWHHRTDAFSSIPVAIAVIGAKVFPGFGYFDQIGAIIVSIMLLKGAWDIVRPLLSELMEAQTHAHVNEDLQRIRDEYPEINDIHKLWVRRVGNSHYVEFHMLVNGSMTVQEAHAITDEIRQKLRDADQDIADVNIHIEPSRPD